MDNNDNSHPHGDWEDSEELPAQTLAYHLLEQLAEEVSPEEHRAICARLVLGARYLDPAQLLTLSKAVRVGPPKRRRGAPKNKRRASDLWFLVCLGPALGGMYGRPRAEVIQEVTVRFRMTPEAAAKAYDATWREVAASEAARSVHPERNQD